MSKSLLEELHGEMKLVGTRDDNVPRPFNSGPYEVTAGPNAIHDLRIHDTVLVNKKGWHLGTDQVLILDRGVVEKNGSSYMIVKADALDGKKSTVMLSEEEMRYIAKMYKKLR